MTEVSVVIPTRNRWPLLSRHALPSALSQRGVRLEVVVVDEASSDETAEGLSRLDDPRLRVVRNTVALRLPGARNAGAAVATGTWIAFLDDDDIWSPNKLRVQIDAAEAANSGWVYGRAIVVDEACRALEDDPFPQPEQLPTLLLGGNWIPGGGSNVIVRRDLFERVGGFDSTLRFFEDWDLWLRLLELEFPSAVDEVVVGRVEHGSNMVVRDKSQVLSAFESVLGKQRVVTRADRRGVLEWLADEQVRAGHRLAGARLFARLGIRERSPGNMAAALGALGGVDGLDRMRRFLMRGRGTHFPLRRPSPTTLPGWLAEFQ